MNNCCHTKDTAEHYPRSFNCPLNGKSYASVKRKTMLHHLLRPWDKSLSQQGYYFCTDPDCDVVYFGQDNMTVLAEELRTTVWQKSQNKKATICYCFGVTRDIALLDKSIKGFVSEQTKQSQCSCETSNPSGRCCLKDFPPT